MPETNVNHTRCDLPDGDHVGNPPRDCIQGDGFVCNCCDACAEACAKEPRL